MNISIGIKMEIRAIDGSVRYSAKAKTFRELVEKAVAEGVDLSCVSIRWRDLKGAKMAGVKMPGADLTGTDMRDSILRDGDFRWTMQQGIEWESFTKLDGADVTDLNLTGARMIDMELALAKNRGAYQDESCLSETSSDFLNLPGSELPAAFMEQSDLMAVNQDSGDQGKDFWEFLKPIGMFFKSAGCQRVANQEKNEGLPLRR